MQQVPGKGRHDLPTPSTQWRTGYTPRGVRRWLMALEGGGWEGEGDLAQERPSLFASVLLVGTGSCQFMAESAPPHCGETAPGRGVRWRRRETASTRRVALTACRHLVSGHGQMRAFPDAAACALGNARKT